MSSLYSENIRKRSFYRFLLGIVIRIPRYLEFKFAINIARRKGAEIGKNVCLFKSFANKLNKNVHIGNNVSISECELTSAIYNLSIGNNSIIGHGVKFLMSTHDIDSTAWTHYRGSEGLEIEDYVWICPYAIILPSVKRIGRGAVIGAGSVVTKDVEPMTVVGGNPAKELRKRACVHEDLCVESLLGGDLKTYYKAWINR